VPHRFKEGLSNSVRLDSFCVSVHCGPFNHFCGDQGSPARRCN